MSGMMQRQKCTRPTCDCGSNPSPFFKLPAELRNMVYEYVLGGNNLRSGHSGSVKMQYMHLSLRLRSLLLVNCQLNSESALLLYSANTFQFKSQDALSKFLEERTQMQLQALRTLRL